MRTHHGELHSGKAAAAPCLDVTDTSRVSRVPYIVRDTVSGRNQTQTYSASDSRPTCSRLVTLSSDQLCME